MKNIVTKRQIDELLEKSEIKVETVYRECLNPTKQENCRSSQTVRMNYSTNSLCI